MIPELIKAWGKNKAAIRAKFRNVHPSYEDIVAAVVEHMPDMDKDRITRIDHGEYQGTLLFIIGGQGYQPSRYWAVKLSYGSCSVCDTIQGIKDDCDPGAKWDAKPNKRQRDAYMTLALHIVQGLKEI